MITLMDEEHSSGDYDSHAARLNREADTAMGVFLATLSEADRVRVLGVKKPGERPRYVGLDADVAESPAASFSTDMAAECDDLVAELREQFRFLRGAEAGIVGSFIERKVAEESERYNNWLLTRITARLVEAGNVKIVAVSCAFAISVPIVYVNGQLCRTQMQAAEALPTTRQNLSKEVRKSAEWLGIEEGIHLKRPDAIESFRTSQIINHWRKRLYGAS